MADIKRILQKQFCVSIDRFKEGVLNSTPWAPRSILMSEGFAFCAVSDMLGVDVVLESGVYNGRSTQIWANYFPSGVPIIAIDRRNFRETTINRLKSYKNVELTKGDGPNVISDLIPKFSDKKISIFMDGPKDIPALDFAKKVLPLPNVVLVAIHDMSVTIGRFEKNHPFGRKRELYFPQSRIEFDKWELGQFLTDEEWFVKGYSWLDKDESQFDSKQKLRWTPYVIIGTDRPDRELNSYGPTVGFAFQREINNFS